MQKAKEIRNHVFKQLNGKIKGVKHYFNSQPAQLNVEHLPALAVYLSDLQADEMTMCGTHWQGNLNVSLYAPASDSDFIDDTLEKILSKVEGIDFDAIDTESEVSRMTYLDDDGEGVWRGGNIAVVVRFYREAE